MATIIACDEYIAFSNGKRFGIAHFSCPDKISYLEVPELAAQGETSKQTRQKQQDKHNQEEFFPPHHGQNKGDNCQKGAELGTENLILASALSRDGQLLAVCDDRKYLHVYQVRGGLTSLCFSSPLVHRCTAVTFSGDSRHVLVADKSGDVYAFSVSQNKSISDSSPDSQNKSISDSSSVSQNKSISDSSSVSQNKSISDSSPDSQNKSISDSSSVTQAGSNGETSGGTLLLGHHSMLLDLVMADRDRLVVTCDRDEKIRISHFPEGHNIRSFCLGHTQFVVSLAYDDTQQMVISGSGDGTVRLWTLDGLEVLSRNVVDDLPTDGQFDKMETDQEKIEETTLSQTNGGEDRHPPQTAVKQICYMQSCRALLVVIYKCPHVLIYQLSSASASGHPSLELQSVLTGRQEVVKISLTSHGTVWVVRQEEKQLLVSVYRLLAATDGGNLQAAVLSDKTSPELMALGTISSQSELLGAPPASLDLIPHLWKFPFKEQPAAPSGHKRLSHLGQTHTKRHRR